MKPIVSALNAWNCIVVSIAAIIILSIIGSLFNSNNHTMMGEEGDPKDGKVVAGSIFWAVLVYAVFLVFCGLQAILHYRASKRGAISLN